MEQIIQSINTDRSKNEGWLRDNFNQFFQGNYYRHDDNGVDLKNPFGLEVVNTGGCHTRAYGVQVIHAMANLDEL